MPTLSIAKSPFATAFYDGFPLLRLGFQSLKREKPVCHELAQLSALEAAQPVSIAQSRKARLPQGGSALLTAAEFYGFQSLNREKPVCHHPGQKRIEAAIIKVSIAQTRKARLPPYRLIKQALASLVFQSLKREKPVCHLQMQWAGHCPLKVSIAQTRKARLPLGAYTERKGDEEVSIAQTRKARLPHGQPYLYARLSRQVSIAQTRKARLPHSELP